MSVYDTDDGSYGSYEAYGSYGAYPRPDAAAYLSGPGSTAYVGGPYAHSYAAENARGGIYTERTSYYGTNLTQVRTYSYHGAGYGLSTNDTFIDYQVQTPGSPLGDGTRYGPPIPVGYGALDSIELYGASYTTSSGSTTDSTLDSTRTEQFDSGYTISYRSHATSESYGGHVVPGSQHTESYATLTDPSGNTSAFNPPSYSYGYGYGYGSP